MDVSLTTTALSPENFNDWQLSYQTPQTCIFCFSSEKNAFLDFVGNEKIFDSFFPTKEFEEMPWKIEFLIFQFLFFFLETKIFPQVLPWTLHRKRF